jgi:hypothetical protein
LKIGTIPSAEGVLVKAGNLQCTGRDLDALGRCAGRDDCPAPSDTRTAGTVSILLGAESAYRFNILDLCCSKFADEKWDEFFMSFWAQRRMKMGLGWEVVHA